MGLRDVDRDSRCPLLRVSHFRAVFWSFSPVPVVLPLSPSLSGGDGGPLLRCDRFGRRGRTPGVGCRKIPVETLASSHDFSATEFLTPRSESFFPRVEEGNSLVNRSRAVFDFDLKCVDPSDTTVLAQEPLLPRDYPTRVGYNRNRTLSPAADPSTPVGGFEVGRSGVRGEGDLPTPRDPFLSFSSPSFFLLTREVLRDGVQVFGTGWTRLWVNDRQ